MGWEGKDWTHTHHPIQRFRPTDCTHFKDTDLRFEFDEIGRHFVAKSEERVCLSTCSADGHGDGDEEEDGGSRRSCIPADTHRDTGVAVRRIHLPSDGPSLTPSPT